MRVSSLSPWGGLLLGLPTSLFLGAFLSDWAYYRSYEIQWINFSAWLIAGALVFTGILLLFAIIGYFRRREGGRPGLTLVLVAITFVVGFVNALIHARDGWATMPAGLWLSLIVLLLILAAAWAGLSSSTRRVEAN